MTTPNGFSVVDALTNTVTATVPTGNLTVGVALTPDGATAYVANNISVIDTATQTVVATLPTGSSPWGIAIGREVNVPPVLATPSWRPITAAPER